MGRYFLKLGPKANSNSHQHFERQKLTPQVQSLHHLELPWLFHKSKAVKLNMCRILFLTFSDILQQIRTINLHILLQNINVRWLDNQICF